ncbi:serine/threonine-protein kinase PITSLRE [Teleopsis dalmanni]|uniref:serine/threonine-protein kinase PITSLRE n=1 Tax=Teleopsis dalmanni TaxID=139649 RepID=UPI0018CE61BE|nr:serine/threonine-protein kinase PITSLRE [Teleopsis dalmanni]
MSGSEDGQLKSPNEDRIISADDDEHDTDSLDIKPPQASAHARDPSGTKKKDKSSKDKKHSKDRKHKDKERDRDRGDYREHRREERNDIERYYQRNAAYEREETREMMSNSERRYQKHYDRNSDGNGRSNLMGSSGSHSYHNPYQHAQYHHQSQMHLQRQRQDYYERNQVYHHIGSSTAEYHNNRYHKHSTHVDYMQSDIGMEMQRDRRKYEYDQQNDAESLEQDLRSRLLSKRHKYVRGSEIDDTYERTEHDKNERSYEDRERNAFKMEKKSRRIKEKSSSVIEVIDSPEIHEEDYQKHKHKKRNKKHSHSSAEKHKTPEDPELLARRAKLLAAEREIEKRKEAAREELEARREMRKERKDALSPTTVAANVTAGLKVVKRKTADIEIVERKRSKKSKEFKNEDEDDSSESDDDDDETEDDDESDSNSDNESDSEEESEKSYKDVKSKKEYKTDDKYSTENDVDLPDSPMSIGDLSKSPKRTKRRKKDHTKHTEDVIERHKSDTSTHSERSCSASRSPSKSPQSAHSSNHRSRSSSRHSSHSPSPSSRSRSRSVGSRSRSRSQSPYKSRSRSRSEERDMKLMQEKPELREKEENAVKKKQSTIENENDSPICDDKGVRLPNYFPGVQGCRSVEEFQCLNRIEEGTYGVVYRAKDKRTNEIVALKRLKMEKEKEGFPITSLREINTLLKGQHPNIVTVREIVVGSNMDKIFIVMDYVEHDLKSLMETMKSRKQVFFPGEVKCLTQQLIHAVGHLHDNWILHRDLKTSNLLLSHKGILKVGDFGLAREYGSPLKKYTSLVVTLWYRAPELLLCSPEYSTPIDIWSVGCIFAEFLQMAPLFPGKTESEELNKIFKLLGTPNEKIWPGYKDLPLVKNLLSQNSQFADYPVSNLRKHFIDKTSEAGISFLQGLLTYDPKQRLNAEAALKHPYFKELPLPIDPSMFPTWPAKSELESRKAIASSPKPPPGGSQFKQLGRDDIITTGSSKVVSGIITGNKKTASNTGFVLNAGIDQRQLAMGPGFSLKF